MFGWFKKKDPEASTYTELEETKFIEIIGKDHGQYRIITTLWESPHTLLGDVWRYTDKQGYVLQDVVVKAKHFASIWEEVTYVKRS